MENSIKLVEELNILSKQGIVSKDIPDFIVKNLNPKYPIREYQKEAFARLRHYLSNYQGKKMPVHLLFNMATGSGKTLLMAVDILYLYSLGCRNFIFFVNSTNIIKKTQSNFLDSTASKYLFADKVAFNDREIEIREVENFEAVNPNNINILFTTVQGLHSRLNTPQENSITYEDFEELKDSKYEDRQLYDFIYRAINDLKKEPTCGTKILKRLWPKIYIRNFGINNLWKYDLPNGWRLVYTIETNEIKIISIILEWFDHKEYEKKFNY